MSAFDTATKFFHACEAGKGWEGCREFAAPGASFVCQAEPLADIDTLEGYCEWVAGISNGPLIGCTYDLASSAYDETNNTATFVSTFNATHTGAGGPVDPTGKSTSTHYVYSMKMNADGKVEKMLKVWNSGWALSELGWM